MQSDLSQTRKSIKFTVSGKECSSNIFVISGYCTAETKHQQAINVQRVLIHVNYMHELMHDLIQLLNVLLVLCREPDKNIISRITLKTLLFCYRLC